MVTVRVDVVVVVLIVWWQAAVDVMGVCLSQDTSVQERRVAANKGWEWRGRQAWMQTGGVDRGMQTMHEWMLLVSRIGRVGRDLPQGMGMEMWLWQDRQRVRLVLLDMLYVLVSMVYSSNLMQRMETVV